MVQYILVYIIIGLAVIGALRFLYRKLKAFKKNKTCENCAACPLKEKCTGIPPKGKDCCCH